MTFIAFYNQGMPIFIGKRDDDREGPWKVINKLLNIIQSLRIKIMQIDSDTSMLVNKWTITIVHMSYIKMKNWK